MISFPAHSSYHLIKLLFVCCMLLDRKKMWRIAARLQYTKFLYSFKAAVHQTFIELLLIKACSLAFRLAPTVFTDTS